MNIVNIETELRKIQALVVRWGEQGYVPQIEKNIALQRVQKFYELFLELDTQPQLEHKREPIITPDPQSNSSDTKKAEIDGHDVVEYIEVDNKEPKVEPTFMVLGSKISASQKEKFTHDLFCNDPLVFHNEVAKLEKLPTFDDVLIYISEKYTWSPSNAAANDFIEILEQKFQ